MAGPLKYSIITFGCRVNQADSLAVAERLCASGAIAAATGEADLVVVNTCSVTSTADQDARQVIRRVARQNPTTRIVVTGCYATRRPQDVRALTNLVELVSNDDKPRIAEIVGADAENGAAGPSGSAGPGAGVPAGQSAQGRTAFALRVQTGCDEGCSYCVVPLTRGPARSEPAVTIFREVTRLAAGGYREVLLTGVHLGSYGRDLAPASSLVALLRALEVLAAGHQAGRCRDARPSGPFPQLVFRLGPLEPMDCGPDVVRLVAESDRFAHHLHLPLQHASNAVLARMRRPYTIEQCSALVSEIRSRMPDAAIGSDLIAGFPGETDADFETLARFLEQSPLTHLHVFRYSDRPGTTASTMRGKVPAAVARERAQRLRGIGRRLHARFCASQVGTVRRALTLADGSSVLTDNYLKLRIPPGRLRNERVRVRVLSAGDPMTGEVVS
jgi:threonylcarbamoyladenosine tRNA methylthiotransferase MtaB